MLFLVLLLCINLHQVELSDSSKVRITYCENKEKLLHVVFSLRPDFNDSEYFQDLLRNFQNKCGYFYNIEVIQGNTTIAETLKLINHGLNVINLWASDYYNHISKGEDDNKLVYAGDVWSKDPSKAGEEYRRVAKVVSESIGPMNSGDLLAFIESLGFNDKNEIISQKSFESWVTNTTELDTVLLCVDMNRHIDYPCFYSNIPYSESLDIKAVPTKKCGISAKIYGHKLLAVLAPSPFKTDLADEVIIPTIFYETPYMNSEYETYFPNSMNLVSGLLVKHAFMKIINDAHWRRVAIISDDSAYSIEFEKEMLDLFHEYEIMYNVQRCETLADLDKAVRYLTSVDARIVIANVDEEHAKKLKQVMPRNSKFTLLFRVLPFWSHENWISITMGPKVRESTYDCDGISEAHCAGAILGLSLIATARHTSVPKELHRATFYRSFTNTMKNLNVSDAGLAYVKRTEDNIIMKMIITEKGVITPTKINNRLFTKPVPDQQQCKAKVNNFAKPCDYRIYLYIMLVIMMFAITLLTITCYFHETSPLWSSYQHL